MNGNGRIERAVRPANNASIETSASSASPATINATVAAGIVESRDLFKGASTVFIHHANQRYVLRVTRENKLILTK